MAEQLTRIKIENFRGIREGELDGLTDVNILVGRNNSGKSTVLEAIVGLAAAKLDSDPIERQRSEQVRVRRNEQTSPDHTWWFRQDRSLKVSVTIASNEFATTGELMPEAFLKRSGFQFVNHHPVTEAILKGTLLFDTADVRSTRIERLIWGPLSSRRGDKRLVEILNEVFGFGAEGTTFLPEGTVMILFPEYGARIDDQGDGTRACFRLLLAILETKPTLLLLEEPETHQHPKALENSALAICKAAKNTGTQIVLTTHSQECARYFLSAAQQTKLVPTLFGLTLAEGKLSTRRVPADSAMALFEIGRDVRFLDLYG